MSGALVPARGANLQKEGQADWVASLRSTTTFTLDVLARLSQADLSPATVAVGLTICNQFVIKADAQKRIYDALESFSSYGKFVWFGFGIKPIVKYLAATEEGMACVALCACMVEVYNSCYVAEVLQELCKNRGTPPEFVPSLHQWTALVQICAGSVSNSKFPTHVENLTRLVHPRAEISLRRSTSTEAFAKAIGALADVSNEKLANVTIVGGPECIWLAALSEWLLSLGVEIRLNSGITVYRSSHCFPAVAIVFTSDELDNPDYDSAVDLEKLRSGISGNQSLLDIRSMQRNQELLSHRVPVENQPARPASEISDDASAPTSVIFSVQTVPSTAITGNSLLTHVEMKRATDELVNIFLDDIELEPLYRAAMDDKRIGPERFARNFKRLLKAFSLDLKEEVRDSVDLELANLVSSKASLVATRIRRVLKPVLASPEAAILDVKMKDLPAEGLPVGNARKATVEEDIGVTSDDEEREEADNEMFAALVAQGRSFIEESNAFKKLRKDFRNFVMPPLQQIPQPEPTIGSETRPEVSSDSLPGTLVGIAQKIYRNVLALLSDIGLRESDIPPGHQRFRWTTRRGRKLYDDYIEHEPGALQALQDYLNASAYRSRTTPESGQSCISAHSVPSRTSINSSTQASSSDSGDIADQPRKTPIGSNRSNRVQNDIEQGEISTRSLHLLSCMEMGRHAVDLYQELVTDITDDRHLFRALRHSYFEHRGRLRPYWSLRTIHSIHFMKFLYGGRRYIDVRCHDDICEHGKPCDCIPPVHLVHPKGTEYECQPVPSKLSPPVGPRLMMDFFTNPDGIEPDATLVLQQLPKRICGELRSQSFEVTEAWGIFFKEDWDWVKIWWVLAIGFFLPSLLFGILWGILKKDIQGAFGVSSWWMTGATILVGVVGTCTWTL